jgi:protein SCO1/2
MIARTRRIALFLALPVWLVATFACRKPQAPAQRYPVKGKVVEVALPEKQLTIEHEDIPGYMPAMTMPFPVKDEALLKIAAVGDEVTASLVIQGSQYWLEDLTVTRKTTGTPMPVPRSAAAEVKPGEAVPDVTLVNQDGRRVRLADYRGRALALTFIYTRCPLPDFCPLMMQNFVAVEAALAAEPALHSRTRLLSVSFDTKHDTPEVLKRFGRSLAGEGPQPFAHWQFASGTDLEIRKLGDALGLEFDPDKGMWVHNLRTAVIGPDGTLVRVIHGNDWKPDELVADLRAAADRR